MSHSQQISRGERFAFGDNWSRFLDHLDDERIRVAEVSLTMRLSVETLKGKTFLDAGSGSGLFSLAARRLGAIVYSFDYDPHSVACNTQLKRRFFPDDPDWRIEEGSVLDRNYVSGLGMFDVVYSWGVLHHTGAMWVGIEHTLSRVAEGGQLFIAIYNDQGWKSHFWWFIKFLYNKLPRPFDTIYAYLIGFGTTTFNVIKHTLRLKPMTAVAPLLHYKQKRGMSARHDLVDWIGGFPFEFARFDVLTDYMNCRGFVLEQGKRATSLGCHELVFRRTHSNP